MERVYEASPSRQAADYPNINSYDMSATNADDDITVNDNDDGRRMNERASVLLCSAWTRYDMFLYDSKCDRHIYSEPHTFTPHEF